MKNQIIKVIGLTFICLLLIGRNKSLHAQSPNNKFRVFNRVISLDKSGKVIKLNVAENAGIAWILGKEFTEGEVEFDIKGADKFQSSFVGFAFHGLDDKIYEAVYFRPFNFRATDSLRKSHSVQYISNPAHDWPVLREQFPDKYENSIAEDVDPNGWFHVKLVLSDDLISVYVNNNNIPAMEIKSLGYGKGRMLGYWVGNGSGGEWKNLRIKKQR